MVKERKEISGYIPLIYKKFISLDINPKNENLDEINEDKSLMSSQDQLEFGISDAAQWNKSYDNLISYYNLGILQNSEMIEDILRKHESNNKSNNTKLIKEILNHSYNYSEIINNVMQKQKEEEIIALWRINKYSIKSISAKTQVLKEAVNKILSKYRKLVKQQRNARKKKRWGKRFAVLSEQIVKIKNYLECNKHRPICVRDLKKAIWPQMDNQRAPSDSTICSILKREFWMSYRLLEKKNIKSINPPGTRKFIQALSLQFKLTRDNIEMIYVDEFSFSSRK